MSRPLEQTLARLAALDDFLIPFLRSEPDDQPGWVSGAALMADESPYIADILRRVAAHYVTQDRRAPAALWFGHHAFIIMAFPIASYFIEQRVPDLRPEDLWMRFDERGEVAALAWRRLTFAALPGDAAAADPDCTVLESREALQARLCEQILGYFEAMIPAVRARSSFGQPGLWALLRDYFSSTFTWAAGLVGPEAAGAAEMRRVTAGSPRLRRKRDYIVVEHCGRSYHLIDRVSCCLYYTLKDGEYCTSCPHRPREDRIALIKHWMEGNAAEH